jgi:tRNA threonylcarbamoyladenosine biosynthesis protein TsaB
MRVLALDTSGTACSVALLDGDRLAAHRFEPMARGHAERLMPMVAAVVEAGGLDGGFAALDLIAATVGPGAFTGIRIGLAAARAMGMAAGRPVVGVTAFEALAEAVPTELRAGRTLLVAIDSRRENLFVQAIGADGEPLGEPGDAAPHAVPSLVPPGALVVAGDAARRAAAALEAAGRGGDVRIAPGDGLPDAARVARVAARRAAAVPAGGAEALLPLPRPLYLRAPAVTLPRRSGTP